MQEAARVWFEKYEADYPSFKDAANEARQQVVDALSGRVLNVQLVEARAKAPESVAEKIERKGYASPSRHFDDLIGVRVITLFEHSIDDAVGRLRSRFDVDEKRSANKTKDLKLRQVGYRSSHLIVRVRKSGDGPAAKVLKRSRVEIQVRSVISHAWAEIEHSLRYKVGDGIPESLARRFDALAGTLELVDREFSSIAKDTADAVVQLAGRYSSGIDLHQSLSAVQLLAALRAFRPRARKLGADDLYLPIEDAFRLAKLLEEVGIRTVGELASELLTSEVSRGIEQYASIAPGGIEPEEASGLVVVATAIGLRDREVFSRTGAAKDTILRESLGLTV